ANGAGANIDPSGPRLIVDVLIDGGAEPDAQTRALLAEIERQNRNILLCPFANTTEDACRLGGQPLTPERAAERAEEARSLAQLLIPADIGARLEAGEAVTVIYRSDEGLTAPSLILQAVQAAALRTGAVQVAVDAAESIVAGFPALTFRDEADRAAFFDGVRARAQALWQTDPIAVNYVQSGAAAANPGTSGFSQSVPGIGSMYVMLTILPAVGAFIRAKREGTLQRLVTMPVRRSQILGGMLLARFLLGLIQYGIVFGFGLFLGVRYGTDPLALILVMVSFTLCVTALMIALTGFIRSEMQAAGITLFMGLTLAPLGGAWWPLDIVPEAMRVIGHISPIAWAMDAYHALIFYGGGLIDVLPSVAVLLGMAAALFAIGVRRFSFES
ncbi:MAG: ABC transporter permease, partial [Anaerolinea sp.]|nr:ABC transporter permease [Anaerolinea sp.]